MVANDGFRLLIQTPELRMEGTPLAVMGWKCRSTGILFLSPSAPLNTLTLTVLVFLGVTMIGLWIRVLTTPSPALVATDKV